nr:hypothetical protein [Tanacetum cinerariifolium]
MIDYALWEVIKNGGTFLKTKVVEGVTLELKFNSIKNAKKLLEALEKGFGGNAATKKTQTNILKHQYKNFTALSSEVSPTSTQVNPAYSTSIDNLSDGVICSFFAGQPNSPKLIHKDLEQIHPDDIEEMDLRWQMAMLTIRARRGHFSKECKALRNQDNKYKEISRRGVPVETSTSIALVSCDGIGGYKWSDQAEEEPNYALMAFLSSSFDSEGNPQMDLQDQGVIDSKCSRHMTGNMSYLTDYKKIDEGYVAFGGNPKYLSPKTTRWNEFSSTMASAIICLATNQKFNFSKFIFDIMIRNFDNVSGKFLIYLRGNTLQSDEHRMKLDELMALCTNLQNKVLDLEQTKTTQKKDIASQQKDIASLKRRVKTLEKRNSAADNEMFDVDVLGGEEVFFAGQNENVVEEVVDAAQGKGIMIEEHVKPKKKDQIRLDEEAAKKLQAEFDEKERLAREKAEKEERDNIALIKE